MALLRPRPRVSLRLPSRVLPGTSFVAEIVLDAKKEIPVDYIDVVLEGTERSRVGDGNHAVRSSRALMALSARVAAKGQLPAGSSKHLARFDLPAALPPSYSGTRANVEYFLTVHVSIPWWPDRKAQYYVVVVAPPASAPDGEGVRFSSRPAGPEAQEPHVECSLAAAAFVPGDVLTGSVALSNVQFNRYRGISIDLVGIELLRTPDKKLQRKSEARRYSIDVPVPDQVQEAQPIPFQLRIPVDVPHARNSMLFDLAWYVQVTARLAWARDVVIDIPISILPGAAKESGVRRAAPTVGADRVNAVWATVAESSRLAFEDGCLSGAAGDVQVQIRREHRGRKGIYLIGECAMPALGLGLEGGPARGLADLWSSSVQTGDPAWDRRNRLRGREAKQVAAFLAPLRTAILKLDLDKVDDRNLRLHRKEAGLTVAPLEAFVRDVLRLARTLEPARRAIPVPEVMRDAEAGWMTLAQRLGTSLGKGNMTVAGHLDQVEVEVVTEWDDEGAPTRTVLLARAADPVRDAHRLSWRQGSYSYGGRERLPESARGLLDAALESAIELSIDEQGIEAALPAPLLDASPVLGYLRTLCDLLTSLRLAAGPYR